jgi:hypothetical protein
MNRKKVDILSRNYRLEILSAFNKNMSGYSSTIYSYFFAQWWIVEARS